MIEVDKEPVIHNGIVIIMNASLITDEKEQDSVRQAIDFGHADGDAVVHVFESLEKVPDWFEVQDGDRFIPSNRLGILKMDFPDESFVQPLYKKILGEGLLLTARRVKFSGICSINGVRKFYKELQFSFLNV